MIDLMNFFSEFCVESGPIRPPSESRSLLLRLVRNCPWNRCRFCPVYKNERFSIRPLNEIIDEISSIREAIDRVVPDFNSSAEEAAVKPGWFREWMMHPGISEDFRRIVAWMASDRKSVFFQDADPLMRKSRDIFEILETIQKIVPAAREISSYARSSTIDRISDSDLNRMKLLGLTRLYIGFESGSDEVLALMQKGVTARIHIDAATRATNAGLALSTCYMPGLGGVSLTQPHAVESARTLSLMKPHIIRLRTLAVVPGTPLHEDYRNGLFQPLTHREILNELAMFLENLKLSSGRLESDHVLNILDLHGTLPGDIPFMLGEINKIRILSEMDQNIYFIGKRLNIFRSTDDIQDRSRWQYAQVLWSEIHESGAGLEQVLSEITSSFL